MGMEGAPGTGHPSETGIMEAGIGTEAADVTLDEIGTTGAPCLTSRFHLHLRAIYNGKGEMLEVVEGCERIGHHQENEIRET